MIEAIEGDLQNRDDRYHSSPYPYHCPEIDNDQGSHYHLFLRL